MVMLNLYNMNNGYTNFLQQGCGLNNIFTNCYGEQDYGAMTGYSVFNALLGVGMQAYATHKANKAPEVNYTQENKKIQEEIKTKQDKITEFETSNTEENGKIRTASDAITKLNTELGTAKTTLENAEKALSKTPEGDENLKTRERELKEAQEAYEKIKKDIEAEEQKIKDAKLKIEANNKEIAKLRDEITELEAQQAKYQKAIDSQTIKDSKSVSWKRADESCIDMWQTKQEGVIADAKQMNRASYEYRHTNDPDEKKKYAQALINMYESNPEGLKKYKCLYEAVKREQNL